MARCKRAETQLVEGGGFGTRSLGRASQGRGPLQGAQALPPLLPSSQGGQARQRSRRQRPRGGGRARTRAARRRSFTCEGHERETGRPCDLCAGAGQPRAHCRGAARDDPRRESAESSLNSRSPCVCVTGATESSESLGSAGHRPAPRACGVRGGGWRVDALVPLSVRGTVGHGLCVVPCARESSACILPVNAHVSVRACASLTRL